MNKLLVAFGVFLYSIALYGQLPREPILDCASVSITDKVISEDAGTFTFQINSISGCRWTINSNESWMTFSQTIGLSSATITVTYTANPNITNRYGTINVNTRQITVTQYGQPANPDAPEITIASSACGETVLTYDAPFGETYYWQGISCGTSTSNSASTYTVTNSGTYYLRAKDNSSGLWSTNCGSKTVTVTPNSEGGSVSGGGNFCDGEQDHIVLSLQNYTGTIQYWQKKPLLGDWSSILTTNETLELPLEGFNGFQFRAIVKNGNCPVDESTPAIINIIPQTDGGTISGGTNTCLGNSTGIMTLSGYYGDILRWERKKSGGSYSTISGTAGQTSILNTPASAGTYYYRAVVENSSCGGVKYSTTKTIVISSPPVAGTLSGGGTICQGTSTGIISLSGYSGSIVRWERKLNSGSWVNISNTAATFSQTLSSSGTYYYRVLVDNGTCSAAYSNNIIITVRAKPAQPTITSNDDLNCAVHITTLSSSSASSYQWSNGETTRDIDVHENGNYSVRIQDSYGCWSNYSDAAEVRLLPIVRVALAEPLEEGQHPQPILDLESQTTGLCEKVYEIVMLPEGGNIYINGQLYEDDGMNPELENYFIPESYGLGSHEIEYRYTDQTCGLITRELDVHVESYVNEITLADEVYRNDETISLSPSHSYDADDLGIVSFKVDGNTTTSIVPGDLSEGTHTIEQVYTQHGCVDSKQSSFEVKPITYFVNSTSVNGNNYNAQTHAGQLNDVLPLAINDANQGNDVYILFDAPGLVSITAELPEISVSNGSLIFDKNGTSPQGLVAASNAYHGFKFSSSQQNITINNLVFSELGTAVWADSIPFLTITNCNFNDCNTAIASNNVKNVTLDGCDFQNSGNGIGLDLTLGDLSSVFPQIPDPDGPLEMPIPDEIITYDDYSFTITNNSFEDLNRALKINSYFDKRNLSNGNVANNEFMSGVEIINPSKQWVFENNLVENCQFILEQAGFIQCSGFEAIQANNNLNETAFNAGNTFDKVNFIIQNLSVYNFRSIKLIGYNLGASTIDIKNDHTSAIIRDVQIHNTENTRLIEYLDQTENTIKIDQPVVTKNRYVEDGATFKADEIEFYTNFNTSIQYGPFIYDFYRSDENGKIVEYLGSNETGRNPNLAGVALLPDDRIAVTVTSLNENSIGTSEFEYYHVAPNVIITEIPSELEAINAYNVNYEFFPSNDTWTKGSISLDVNQVIWDVKDAYISDPDLIGQIPGNYEREITKTNPFNISYHAVGPRTIGITTNADNWSASSTKSIFISSAHLMLNTDKNYIHKITPRAPITNIQTTTYKEGEKWKVHDDLQQVVQYFDGLGRPTQNIAIASTPGGIDMIGVNVYDQYGREKVTYLPYTRYNLGQYRKDALSEIDEYYNGGTGYYDAPNKVTTTLEPFAEREFDNSPLNRILEQGAPGEIWQIQKNGDVSDRSGHTIRTEYLINGPSEVILWKVTSNGFTALENSTVSYYNEGKLFKTRTKNENDAIVEEYKDFRGNIILSKAYLDETNAASTYYIYDDFNQLRYVIQPEGVKSIIENANYSVTKDEDVYKQFCFGYIYNEKKLLIEKKIPGAEPSYYLYDKLDRLILSQDGNQFDDVEKINDWNFTKYDVFGNVVMTGIYKDPYNNRREDLLNRYNNQLANGTAELHEYRSNESGSQMGYAMVTFPNIVGEYEIHTVTYFDDYDFDPNYTYSFVDVDGYTGEPFYRINGMVTAEKVRTLDTDDWLTTVYFYDKYGHVIQTQKENQLDGVDYMTNEYSFAGELLKTHKDHSVITEPDVHFDVEMEKRFEYDFAGRLKKSYLKVNSDNEFMVSSLNYNELGQLIEKNLHSEDNGLSFLQSVDYEYNIRGWLSNINDANINYSNDNDLFGMELLYEQGFIELSGNAQYNGNISGMKWSGSYISGLRGYGFRYDNLNRINDANYAESGSNWTTHAGAFSVNNINYDYNGNILDMERNSYVNEYQKTEIFNKLYDYDYDGNQLKSISKEIRIIGDNDYLDNESWGEGVYEYDKNGNLSKDNRKNINLITYNHFNLPKNIAWNSNSQDEISFKYDANGNKLEKRTASYIMSDPPSLSEDFQYYIGNFVYSGMDTKMLEFIQEDEGRIVNDEGSYRYEYFLKDHLGNTRVVFSDLNDDGEITVGGDDNEILQETNYYPFGMSFAEQNINYSNKYLYNGKELNDEFNLDWFDYQARYYMPDLGRFTTVDPHADSYFSFSPYSYCVNNPILLVDPDGTDWYRHDETGALLWVDSQDKTYTHNDVTYTNIGANVSIEFAEGQFLNYYQNAAVSISEGGPVNAAQTILNNDGLMGDYLGKNSPLSDQYKSDLLIASMHQTTGKWAEGMLEVAMWVAPMPKIGLLGKGGRWLTKALSKTKATGQMHHLLSNKIMRQLGKHPNLKGVFNRENPAFKYRALNEQAHRGYQKWHREYDKKVVNWLRSNPNATQHEFKNYINSIHQEQWLKSRIPNVKVK